jgi:class 3 adenylate cyclase/pimeloyl-ACP methyl ester carboxylesterase
MEPRIQYANTADGVSIAYYVVGEGPPLIWVSGIWASHLLRQWETPPVRARMETLSRYFTVARYDGRGSGMSDHEPLDYSLDGRIADIEALRAQCNFASAHLVAGGHGNLAAVAYAAGFPDRVSRLVLMNPYARGEDLYRDSSRMRFVAGLEAVTIEEQWEFTTLAMASRTVGTDNPGLVQHLAEIARDSMGPVELLAFREANKRIDVTPLLSQIVAPTLIIHGESDFTPMSYSRTFAATIPDGHLVAADPSPGIMASPDTMAKIARFLGADNAALDTSDAQMQVPAAPSGPATISTPAPERGGFATILFTDVEGSTALTDRLGDAASRELLREHDRVTREALRAHGGSEVKTMGDGFMASFGSATRALECAIAIQNAAVNDSIRVRCGLNAGEPIAEDDDLFGTAVIVAARIAAQAQGGEILVSDVVRQLVAGKGFLFNDRGEHALKGFEDPVRVFEVSWRE